VAFKRIAARGGGKREGPWVEDPSKISEESYKMIISLYWGKGLSLQNFKYI